jgi:hypothetical protein
MTKDEEDIARIALSHGQARWVLRHFDLTSGVRDQSFDALLKSLRRDGVPFAPGEAGRGAGFNLVYGYDHLMELALAFAFRTQGILSRDFVRLIAELRGKLRPLLRRAYLERETGLGARTQISFQEIGGAPRKIGEGEADLGPLEAGGTYLHLALSYMPGGVLAARTCELLGPEQAVHAFVASHRNMYPQPPLPISDIARDIVTLATSDIPQIHRGRI